MVAVVVSHEYILQKRQIELYRLLKKRWYILALKHSILLTFLFAVINVVLVFKYNIYISLHFLLWMLSGVIFLLAGTLGAYEPSFGKNGLMREYRKEGINPTDIGELKKESELHPNIRKLVDKEPLSLMYYMILALFINFISFLSFFFWDKVFIRYLLS